METFRRPPAFVNPDDMARLREALRAANYSMAGVCNAYNVNSYEAFKALAPPVLSARMALNRPIDVLLRVFSMGESVETGLLAGAVAPMEVAALADAGLVRIDGFYATAVLGLTPYEGLVLCHDIRVGPGGAGADFVMGVAGTSRSIAAQMIRRKSKLTLDLGTGCGVLALLAARHSERVIGTDLNETALIFARFNAALNGVDNCEFRAGSLFEPVAAERFDHIICNPPFVITPRSGYMYRDSGMAGDGITEAVVRGAGPMLADGGIAQVIGNWANLKTRRWQDRVTEWVRESGCDALALSTKTVAALEYASGWIEETEKTTPQQRWQTLMEWMQAYGELGIDSITYGSITLHKTSGRLHWMAIDEAADMQYSWVGEHIAQMIAARDFLAGLAGEADLADARLAPAANLRVEQQLRHGAGGWQAARSELRLIAGYPYPKTLDANQMGFVMSLDGAATVRQRVDEAAAKVGQKGAALLPLCLKLCRQMVERGMLVVK